MPHASNVSLYHEIVQHNMDIYTTNNIRERNEIFRLGFRASLNASGKRQESLKEKKYIENEEFWLSFLS